MRLHSADGIRALARAGAALSRVLGTAHAAARAGVTRVALGDVVARCIAGEGAEPLLASVRNSLGEPFAGAASILVNDELGAAIPDGRALAAGDLVTIDVALRLAGWCADAATCLVVPGDEPEHPLRAVLERARGVLRVAMERMGPGVSWSSVSEATNAAARDAGLAIVPEFGGHGIGLRMQEPPRLAFCTEKKRDSSGLHAPPSQDFVLQAGMVFTLEPVLTPGCGRVHADSNAWTLRTSDGAACVCEELMVCITPGGASILASGPGWSR